MKVLEHVHYNDLPMKQIYKFKDSKLLTKTEQNKAKQSKAKQSKKKQSKTKQR